MGALLIESTGSFAHKISDRNAYSMFFKRLSLDPYGKIRRNYAFRFRAEVDPLGPFRSLYAYRLRNAYSTFFKKLKSDPVLSMGQTLPAGTIPL